MSVIEVNAGTLSPPALLHQYKRDHLLLIRGYADAHQLSHDTLHKLSLAFQEATPEGKNAIRSSWKVETIDRQNQPFLTPEIVLGTTSTSTSSASSSTSSTSSSTSLSKSVTSSSLPPPLMDSWYCSFVAQGDVKLFQDVLHSVPPPPTTPPPPTPTPSTTQVLIEPSAVPVFLKEQRHGEAAWVFIGQQTKKTILNGRPEHVDRILHDGTYHVQCEGEKVWNVRPDWMYRGEQQPDEEDDSHSTTLPKDSLWRTCSTDGIEMVVQKGDLLVINTRLWAHRTTLPKSKTPPYSKKKKTSKGIDDSEDAATATMSISIARDFYFQTDPSSQRQRKEKGKRKRKRQPDKETQEEEEEEAEEILQGEDGEKIEMGNVDAFFSTRSFEKGDVVFTEDEFSRAATSGAGLAMCAKRSDANCDVVKRVHENDIVIIALRKIEIDDIIMLLDPSSSQEQAQ